MQVEGRFGSVEPRQERNEPGRPEAADRKADDVTRAAYGVTDGPDDLREGRLELVGEPVPGICQSDAPSLLLHQALAHEIGEEPQLLADRTLRNAHFRRVRGDGQVTRDGLERFVGEKFC